VAACRDPQEAWVGLLIIAPDISLPWYNGTQWGVAKGRGYVICLMLAAGGHGEHVMANWMQ
jgi:hypothetical protein